MKIKNQTIQQKHIIKMNFKTFTIAVSIIVLSACGGGNDLASKKQELASLKAKVAKLEAEINSLDTSVKVVENTEVVAAPVTSEIFKTYVEVQGRVDADENVSLSSQMPGVITKIHVKVGQQVNSGQVLAETDASVINQQISDLQTNLDLAKLLYKKQENLWKQGIGTEMQYLSAKSNKESLEKKMGTLLEQLRMSKIISPISGTVDAVNVKIGQLAAPGMPAINVVNLSSLKVKADIAESYASRIKSGNEVIVYFPDIKDSISSKIHYSSRSINLLTRTFGVEVLLSSKLSYQPNMVAKLKINDYRSAKPQIVVPVKFIQKGSSEVFVLVAENGIAVKKPVVISREYNGMAEISEGLKIGDLVITEGYDRLNEGDKIQLKK
jgi:RND family efflux transporter MFP subunit